MADNRKVPPFILNTKFTCTEHNDKLTEFCRVHDLPVCIKCRRKFHKKCENVPKIEDIVRNVKESVLFQDIFLEIENVCSNLKEIFEDRVKNKEELENVRATLEKSLEERIDNIVKHLGIQKETTLNKFDSVTSEISETSKIVQSKENKLRNILCQKSEIIRLSSNYQTFIAVKHLENMVHETNMDIHELFSSGKLDQQNVALDLNEAIEDTIYNTKSFGDIRFTQSPSAVPIKMTRPADLEAQKEVQTMEPIFLHFKQKIGLFSGYYRGCCILPSGYMVFTENVLRYKYNVHIHQVDGSFRSTIRFKEIEGLYDVSPVDDQHFAVSHPWSRTISVIDINTNKVVRKLQTGGQVWGLCCSGKDIIYCVSGKGLVKVNIDSGDKTTVKMDANIGYNSHVEVSTNLICYTCPRIHTVTLLDSQYNVIFAYKDEEVIKSPNSVTIDDFRNIYVTGYDSNNLVIISPDGKSCRVLLGKDDGLEKPTGVHYDSSTKKLLVLNSSSWDRSAFVYIVQGTFLCTDDEAHNDEDIQGKDDKSPHVQARDDPLHVQGKVDKQKEQKDCTIS